MNKTIKILTIPLATGFMLGGGFLAGAAFAGSPEPTNHTTSTAEGCMSDDYTPSLIDVDAGINPDSTDGSTVDATVDVGTTNSNGGTNHNPLVDVDAKVNTGNNGGGSSSTPAPTTPAPNPSTGGNGGSSTPPSTGGNGGQSLIDIDGNLGLLGDKATNQDNNTGKLIDVNVLGNLKNE